MRSLKARVIPKVHLLKHSLSVNPLILVRLQNVDIALISVWSPECEVTISVNSWNFLSQILIWSYFADVSTLILHVKDSHEKVESFLQRISNAISYHPFFELLKKTESRLLLYKNLKPVVLQWLFQHLQLLLVKIQ